MLREELKKGAPIIKSGSYSIATSNSDQVSLRVNDSQNGSKLSQPDTTPLPTEKCHQGADNLFVTLNKKKVTTSMLSKVSDYSDPGNHLKVLNMDHSNETGKGKRLTRSFYRGGAYKGPIEATSDSKTLDQQVEESISSIIGMNDESTSRKKAGMNTLSTTTKGAKDSKDKMTEKDDRRMSKPDLLEEIFLDSDDQDSNLLFCNSATLKGRSSPKKEFQSFGPINPNTRRRGFTPQQQSIDSETYNFYIQVSEPHLKDYHNSEHPSK